MGKICPMAIAAVSTPGKILYGKAVFHVTAWKINVHGGLAKNVL